ncbi:MAG: DUF1273 family protein [Clostridia bacterium]|nr:DUF1273 family protein [Clostridia bacterium]MBR2176299.1 DUF1273 family protein [Clostridia bacterium]
MLEQTCCFTGHRPQKLPFHSNENDKRCMKLKVMIRKEIKTLIVEKSIKHFISGMAIGTDIIFAEIVLEMKKNYDITLECAIPCRNQSDKWTIQQKERYTKILLQADIVTYLQNDYTKDCMQKRNEYMVDKSEYVIAVWNGSKSGTANTIKYARKKNKSIIIIDLNKL